MVLSLLQRFHRMWAFRARHLKAIVLLIAFSVLAASGWQMFSAARSAIEAEKTHHAYLLVLDLVSVYVTRTFGEWPKSWEDLYPISPMQAHGIWNWPEDAPRVQERVLVDFNVRRKDVASMNIDSFHAIWPITPNYGPDTPAIQHLLKACRRGKESEPAP